MKLSCYCLLEHLLELAALQEGDRASKSPVVAPADELALDEYLRHARLARQCFELGLLGVRYFTSSNSIPASLRASFACLQKGHHDAANTTTGADVWGVPRVAAVERPRAGPVPLGLLLGRCLVRPNDI